MKNITKNILIIGAITFISSPLFAEAVNIDDSAVTKSIKSQIAADKTVSDTQVKVTSNKGAVKIVGNVNDDAEASRLTEIAESTNGVQDVDTSKLTVKESKHPIKDSLITAKIKGKYVREKLFGDKDISVSGIKIETTDGVVYLTGTADDKAQAENAVKIAKSVKGVKSVNSKVIVDSEKK
jgi:hyperosmotically inducible protein